MKWDRDAGSHKVFRRIRRENEVTASPRVPSAAGAGAELTYC
ncbi:hypothetical protein [Streptomyces sp. NPDC002889]